MLENVSIRCPVPSQCATINSALIYFRRRCIPHEWVCDKDFDCSGDDKSDEDETICQFKEKCLPNQSECVGASGAGAVCIETEKFCDGVFDCVNDEYTEYCDNSTLKADCIALNCSHDCRPTAHGAKCYCSKGQQPNGTQCEGLSIASSLG